jgi:hypothetical protein
MTKKMSEVEVLKAAFAQALFHIYKSSAKSFSFHLLKDTSDNWDINIIHDEENERLVLKLLGKEDLKGPPNCS